MAGKLHLSMIAPEKIVFEGEVSRVTFPGTVGLFTILPQHAPIISSLKEGKVSYVTNGEEHFVDILGGFIEMSNEEVSACILLKNDENK